MLHMKILLKGFETKLDREAIFNLAILDGNSLQHNDVRGIRRLNITTSRDLIFKNSVFTHRNSYIQVDFC